MTRTPVVLTVLILALGALSAGIAIAAGRGGTGSPEGKATEAALAAAGGGKLIEVEAGDDAGVAYEAEIEKADGSTVEVLLRADYSVLRIVAEED